MAESPKPLNSFKVYGGDTIESASGLVGTITASKFSLIGKETEYQLDRNPDLRVLESEIVRIISHGRHDYRPGAKRGHCARCDVAKKDHANAS